MESEPYREHREQAQAYKVFDELASVRLMNHDLQEYGHVRPETLRQVYNEELSFVAESINAPLRTRFKLHNTPEGLVDERGTLLHDALRRGVLAAELAANDDPRLKFNLTRAIHDYEEGRLLSNMMRGDTKANTVVSVSPFCDEAYQTHGKEAVKSIGYQPERLLGFIRIYNKLSDDELEVISISVDNSDVDAFRPLLDTLGVVVPPNVSSDDFLRYRAQLHISRAEQTQLPEQLTRIYDQNMQVIYGQEFQAGRLAKDEVEVWGFIESQKDIVRHYFSKLEELAKHEPQNTRAKKQLMIGFWAALKDRLKDGISGRRGYDDPTLRDLVLSQEMNRAFLNAAARHEQMIGCGGNISAGSGDILDASPEDAMTSVMGDKKETYVWKTGVCQVPNCPSPKPTKVGPCKVCINCQRADDSGANLMKLYKPVKVRDNKKIKQAQSSWTLMTTSTRN